MAGCFASVEESRHGFRVCARSTDLHRVYSLSALLNQLKAALDWVSKRCSYSFLFSLLPNTRSNPHGACLWVRFGMV